MTAPECDGTGRIPCRRCNGSGFVAVGRNQLVGCTTCMRKRYTLRCPGCPKCEARKAAMAAAKDDQPRLF